MWRRADESPGCGPDSVTSAPVTTRPNVAAISAADRGRAWRGGAIADGSRSSSTASTVPSPRRTIASRKWDITATGLRSTATVIAPSGPWAKVPIAIASARRAEVVKRPSRRRTATAARTVAAIARKAISRFEYSITGS